MTPDLRDLQRAGNVQAVNEMVKKIYICTSKYTIAWVVQVAVLRCPCENRESPRLIICNSCANLLILLQLPDTGSNLTMCVCVSVFVSPH